jgi:hypothetical protein
MADLADRTLDRILGNGERVIFDFRTQPAAAWFLLREALASRSAA